MVEPTITCEVCHERVATHYLCEPHLQRSRHLCKICFDAAGIPSMEESERQYQEAVRTGKCRFCGAQAVAGCGGSIPLLGERYQFWCEECRKDLAAYAETARAEAEQTMPELSVTGAGLHRIDTWLDEQDRKLTDYMQAKIRERKARQ